VLTGNVVITQGTLTIAPTSIDFKQNADNSLSATAFGNPISFRQKRDDARLLRRLGAARRLRRRKEQLELFDNAILKRGTDEIRSNYISYNSATELFKAEGRPATTPMPASGRNDRVRGTFQPQGQDPAPGKAPPPSERRCR
jgi:lipopolysaccharide export system protein LptA